MTSIVLTMAERGWLPLPALKLGVRRLCAGRLTELDATATTRFVQSLDASAVALLPVKANEQHYEVPARFFELVLGRNLKYSSAYWPAGTTSLDAAEEAMLALTCERAGLIDGQDILELGCGWGSLSLYMAKQYPNSRILSVSNSRTQRAFIEHLAPTNLRVVTQDMNTFDPHRTFDRIVTVEMFEHMRNWPELLRRCATWLREDGRMFVHVFCHRTHAYPFETEGDGNWMGRYFFTGGMMPSFSMLNSVSGAMAVTEQWYESGNHYQRTAEAWRLNHEQQRSAVVALFRETYGRDAELWYHRWRLFFLSCEELFGYDGGEEWGVGHYVLGKRRG